MTTPRPLHRAIAPAAICAVALWSLKPIFIELIEDHVGFAETYLLCGSIAVLTSLALAAFSPRTIRSVARMRGGLARAVANSATSGLFLALWYYGFYRALIAGPSAPDATVIAFSWPLITVVAIRLIAPSTAPGLRWFQWLLLALSFVGVAAISLNSAGGLHSLGQGSGSLEILWAVAAAFGSGLYLPFAMNAATSFREGAGLSGPVSVLVSISVANAVALCATWLALAAFRQPLDFSGVTASTVLVCLIIGLGTYLVAEIAWTWAMQSGGTLTLASLPYFSPAVSVLLLAILFGETLRALTLAGLALILAANLTLHFTGREKERNQGAEDEMSESPQGTEWTH